MNYVHSKRHAYQSHQPNVGNYGIVYIESTQMSVYCDVDLTSNIDDYKSTLGYVFLLSNGAINWSTQKQPYIVIFLTKVKCMVISQTTRQVM
jgi:hypothetical protein